MFKQRVWTRSTLFLILNASFLSAVTQIVTKKIIKAFLLSTWPWLGGDSLVTAKKILQIRKRERLNFGFVHHIYSGGSVRGRWIKVNLNNLLRMGNWFWKFFPWPIHPNGYWQLSVLFPVLTQLLYDHTDNQLWFVLLLIVSPLSAIS